MSYTMLQWLAVALGGALGAMARFAVNGLLAPTVERLPAGGFAMGAFPIGTLSVNVLGSVLIGVAYVLLVEKALLPPQWRDFLMVGFLGAFTTFSTFSLDALALWQNGQLPLAVAYVVLSLLLCLTGAFLAIILTRML